MAAYEGSQTIVFFDGVCHLCNGFVDFILRRDRRQRMKFAPLQGKTAESLLINNDRNSLESIIVIDRENVFRKSSAVLRVFAQLGGVWMIFALLARLIPTVLRDRIYDFVADHRNAWFGQRQFCRLPSQEERGRLLD